MASIKSGKGALNLSNPSKAKLRKIGSKGRSTQRDMKAYASGARF